MDQFGHSDQRGANRDELRVRLSPAFAIIPMDRGVQLRVGDEEIHLLQTEDKRLVATLLQRLQRGATRRQLIDETPSGGDSELVDALLSELDAQRLVMRLDTSAGEHASTDTSRYLESLYPAASAGHSKALEEARIGIIGDNATALLIRTAMEAYGVVCEGTTPDSGADVTMYVCVVERPDLGGLLEANRLACSRSLPCLFADLSHGRHATVGPFFLPGEGACYQCFRQRLRENTASPAEMKASDDWMLSEGPLPPVGCPPGFRYQVAGVVAGSTLR